MRFLLLLAAAGAAYGAEPLRIGSDLQLFVDDYLIESMRGAELRLHSPQPAGKAIAFDQPWEGNVSAYVTVMADGGKMRMYYRGVSDPVYVRPGALKPGETVIPKNRESSCYAESRDGIHWTKPPLGLYEFAGSKENNIIWQGPEAHNFSPFKDANPAAPAAQRYKAVGRRGKGLIAFQSADAIHWSKMREEPVIADGAFDSLNVVFWDPRRERYVALYRDFRQGVRTLKCATSQDFLQWTPGQWADYGATPSEQLYTNATQPYFRAPQMYLAFPKRFVPERQVFDDVPEAGVSEAVFMSSRDGVHWDRRFLEAFIRPGRDRRDWVHRNRMVATGILPTAADEISLYVSRHYNFPSAHLERVVLRTDGFVSVHAGYAGGEMTTKPIDLEGANLALNFSASAAGSVRVDLLDPDGRTLESRTVYGDKIEQIVPVKSGKRAVRLRFVLRDADLYSLRIKD